MKTLEIHVPEIEIEINSVDDFVPALEEIHEVLYSLTLDLQRVMTHPEVPSLIRERAERYWLGMLKEITRTRGQMLGSVTSPTIINTLDEFHDFFKS